MTVEESRCKGGLDEGEESQEDCEDRQGKSGVRSKKRRNRMSRAEKKVGEKMEKEGLWEGVRTRKVGKERRKEIKAESVKDQGARGNIGNIC